MLDALRSSWISGGPYVERLEQEVADHMGIGHAVAVSNGTTALELALRALNLETGAEVIVPGFTFVAAANMVLSLASHRSTPTSNPILGCLIQPKSTASERRAPRQ